MAAKIPQQLSRRERQIMDIIYRQGRATAAEVLDGMADPPSYSAVRALLRVLVEKGHIRYAKAGTRYVYSPKKPRRHAARNALNHVLQTFYEGSTYKAAAALLDGSDHDMSPEELERLSRMIEQAKEEGR